MNADTRQTHRRRHGTEIKAKVLQQCREPGASVSAVALANGLNANLVRSWLEGRGLKRSGLTVEAGAATAEPPMRFVPVELAAPPVCDVGPAGVDAVGGVAQGGSIHVELCCAGASLAVHWPLSQARSCSAWLNELAAVVLKR